MAAEDFSLLGAAEAARRIAQGLLTSEELVADCLARIRAAEPGIQAWTFLDEERALAEARAADDRKRTGLPVGPLHGVPVGVKDIIDTGDMPTENGTVLHRGRMPREDAAVVKRLRAAGAVILGKTVTTECAYYFPGKTRNPWNPEHTPGGSSSGSAAAVAASMVPLALGSQTNGSVIRPAAFCGVYGFKPTHGLIPRTGILKLSRTLDHVGVFGRSLQDVALAAQCLVGHDEDDPDSRPVARYPLAELLSEEPPIPPMIGLLKTPYWDRLDADSKGGFAELVEALGAQVEEVELGPSSDDAWNWHKVIMEVEMAANLEREWTKGSGQLSAALRGLIERGREAKAVDYLRALAGTRTAIASFDDMFMERFDALLTPCAPGPAPRGLDSTGDPVFCSLWSLCGMPSLSLPLLQAQSGLPIGVQLVGRRAYDGRLLRTARWLVERVEQAG